MKFMKKNYSLKNNENKIIYYFYLLLINLFL